MDSHPLISMRKFLEDKRAHIKNNFKWKRIDDNDMASIGSSSTAPVSPGGTKEPLSITSGESEFDETLAVPSSLSVINLADIKKDDYKLDQDVNDGRVHFNTTTLPFNSIHTKPQKFSSPQRKVFIPTVEITVRFINYERSVTAHLLNPNLYTILLTHGDFQWTITKRYKHFLNLHQQLVIYKTSLNIPFPTKTHKRKRESIKVSPELAENAAISGKPLSIARRKSSRIKIRSPALPRFPKKPEVLVSYDDIDKRMKQLEDYLFSLCNITIYRNHNELIQFLEVSHLSFISEIGTKGKEGMVMKRAGSTLPGQAGCDCCGLLHYGVCNRCCFFCSSLSCGKWRERWFFLKDTFFGYISPKDGTVKSVMLFDNSFEVSSGMYSTGLNNGLQILNSTRQLIIRLWTKRQSKEWMMQLKEVANSKARDFTFPNPHNSFAPLRPNTRASSFIDGGGYLNAVADCMEAAKEEIFITDWWLSPELYLKRPVTGDYWRLDEILKRKAALGVKIFILLYKEVEMALGLNSFYSKAKLCHENIKVLRHPDHAKAGVFLWAHHEKIVCIDQNIAFVGGIDLCYGRWDDHNHRLTDLGGISRDVSTRPKTKKKTSSSPFGNDDFLFRQSTSEENCDDSSSTCDRQPVTPLDLESTVAPPPTPSILPVLQPGDRLLMPGNASPNTVFLEDHYNPELTSRRNLMNTISDKSKDILHFFSGDSEESNSSIEAREKMKAERYAASTINLSYAESPQENIPRPFTRTALAPIQETESFLSINDVAVQNNFDDENSKLWIGKDYANFIVKDFTNLDAPFVDLVDRLTTPRMPWHDIAMMVEGAAARDVARHFIQRWNAHKLEKSQKNPTYPYLLPKSYSDINVPNIVANLDKHNVTCQVLRSLTCWSGGFVDTEMVEQSIHEAYIDIITKSQHYVYIENQFFITLAYNNCYVRNQIGESIYKRIMRAHKSGSVFRVFVVMPLLPAFEGEVGASSGTSLHAITHWNYQSICRGKDSLIQRLMESGIKDPSQYITFHGLRSHSVLEEEPVSELIYVHSKLIIVDDRFVICGSANINDRSLLGKRDSEVAVLLQDESFVDGTMNGEIFSSGRFAGSLRKRLFREHLGILCRKDLNGGVNILDPVIDSFYKDVWLATSQNNTEIYEKVFHCIPTDAVRSFIGLKKYQEENKNSLWDNNPVEANNEISKIKGHLVNFPLDFLADEVLTPPNTTMVGMLPTSLWT